MSAPAERPTPSEPRTAPDRVAIETPQGEVQTGDVVDVEMRATARDIQRWYVVEIDGSRFRSPADEAEQPTL